MAGSGTVWCGGRKRIRLGRDPIVETGAAKFSIGTEKLPPLTPPLNLVRFVGTVVWYGWCASSCAVGTLGTVRWYGCVLVATLGIRSTSGKDSWTGVQGGGFPPELFRLNL